MFLALSCRGYFRYAAAYLLRAKSRARFASPRANFQFSSVISIFRLLLVGERSNFHFFDLRFFGFCRSTGIKKGLCCGRCANAPVVAYERG